MLQSNSRRAAFLGALSVLFLPANGAAPQGSCGCPRPAGAPWNAVIRYSSDTYTELIPPQPEIMTIKGPWHESDACDCAYIVPPDRCDRFSCNPGSFTSEVAEETCWESSGTASIELQIQLVKDVLQSIGSFAYTSGTSGCVTITTSRTWPVDRSQCWKAASREIHTKTRNVGKLLVTHTCEWWVRERQEGSIYIWLYPVGTTSCQYVAATATAWITSGFYLQVPPFPCSAECGGRCPPPNPPDEYDNKRRDPCCWHIAPCEEIGPPPDHPCCGCVVEN